MRSMVGGLSHQEKSSSHRFSTLATLKYANMQDNPPKCENWIRATEKHYGLSGENSKRFGDQENNDLARHPQKVREANPDSFTRRAVACRER